MYKKIIGLFLVLYLFLPFYTWALVKKPTEVVHEEPVISMLEEPQDEPQEEFSFEVPNDLKEALAIRLFLVQNNIRTASEYLEWAKHNLTYAPEEKDHWSYPLETLAKRAGDCEDLAFLHQAALKSLGFDAKVMAFGRNLDAHVFTLFKLNGSLHVLDNYNHYPISATSLKQISLFLVTKYNAQFVAQLSLDPFDIKVIFKSES